MSAPSGWHNNWGEHTMIWTTTTRSIPDCLSDLADLLTADDELMLHGLYVTPIEGSDPDAFVVQATLANLAAAPTGGEE